MSTDAEKRASKKYREKNYDVISVDFPIADNQRIKDMVQKKNISIAKYVKQAINVQLQKDGENPID